ncbi:hypothetical protein CRENBAI_009429 [Crenichthys baileyi]|uniref:Uncharacterized protein n=1 Tax=Crenichthys baileyi TaxID=28760 RepID=A0AAV9QV92_9TELE
MKGSSGSRTALQGLVKASSVSCTALPSSSVGFLRVLYVTRQASRQGSLRFPNATWTSKAPSQPPQTSQTPFYPPPTSQTPSQLLLTSSLDSPQVPHTPPQPASRPPSYK